MVRFKEEKYAKLLVKLQGFVGTTTSAKLKREFFEEQYQSWLYASDEVVTAMNDLVRLVVEGRGAAPDAEAGRQAVGNVVLAMRRDLLRTTKLGYDSFRYTDVLE
jgi:signal recognition particle GTPase